MSIGHRLFPAIAFCVAALLAWAADSSGAVFRVCGSGYQFTSIQAAIDFTGSDDTVRVGDGVYAERINFKGKAVTVRSVNGPTRTTIDGGGLGSVVSRHQRRRPLQRRGRAAAVRLHHLGQRGAVG